MCKLRDEQELIDLFIEEEFKEKNMTQYEIVSEADFLDPEGTERILRLFSSYYGTGISETYAQLQENKVTVRWLSSSSKPKSITFNARTMDALCEVWQQFKFDREVALADEEVRKDEVYKQALELANSVPGVEVEERDDIEFNYVYEHGYLIRVPAMAYTDHCRDRSYVLGRVLEAIMQWHDYLRRKQSDLENYQRQAREGHEQGWLLNNINLNQKILNEWGNVLILLDERYPKEQVDELNPF